LGKNQDGENQGYFGLEGYYDNILSSSPGVQKGETDIKGIPILIGKSKKVPSFSGVDLVTYIDKGVQLIADEELKLGIEKYGALNGSVIIMDPATGGILAMSSYPSFNPERYWEYSNELFLNPVISSSFEPGSIFKIIIMASAVDISAVKPDTKCTICSGPVHIDKYEIQTWNNKYFPDSSMKDVIVHSDNVGMTFVAQNIGVERNYEYLKKFGFGEKTGIDLQGESNAPLRKKEDWSEVDLYTSSFGQGIAVTPIQMLAAANVIANGGIYVKPAVVKNALIEETDYDFRKNEDTRRVISQKAATEIKMMMVEAAKNGESKWTYKRGYGVAGKTGTAQIPISGHYDAEKTIASFIGFAPYNNPKFIMLLTLREPKSSPWASETAAPLWYRIAERLFVHFGIMPEK
jgi:cell division protein FtsI/penicillin-binding protein 2